MKKFVLSLFSFVLVIAFSGGSVFASQNDLNKAIDEVVGTPYKWGGTTTSGFDCSGFILYIFNQYETKLPRTSSSQSKIGEKVEKDDLRLGDLVFFNTSGKGVSHAGIYVGDGQFAHSSSSKGVRISKLSDKYYAKRYVTARRVVSGENYADMINEGHESEDDSQVLEE
ncbi:C40 family peptidase [Cohnella herbarum]|uniref:C40 family peptidase n=1 Tax=Cohnella herbarum TaxID=2728023 RepID=A0A7Z2VQJ6_9BACL|nr:C40 family peptidase [Cohnella herbarum]QJD87314.1 C40 family peptidase [Cohnella herbarum]